MKAFERKPDVSGFCPLLFKGEFCRDAHHGLWHFCTPDGMVFSADAERTKKGLTIVGVRDGKKHRLPAFAGSALGTVSNCWTVVDGEWEKI